MIKVGVIDYGLGNNLSICNALEFLGYKYEFTSSIDILKKCEVLILPGVGSFPEGMNNLKEKGLDEFLKHIKDEKKIIGICLGMQLLFSNSEELELTKGLNLLNGKVLKFDNSISRTPNIGWRQIKSIHKNQFLKDKFYFIHSYHVIPDSESVITSISKFDEFEFVSSIKFKNLYGFQFHPEKSSKQGLQLLKRIIDKNK